MVTPNFITPTAMHKNAWERKNNYKAAKGYAVTSTLFVIDSLYLSLCESPYTPAYLWGAIAIFSFSPKHTQGISSDW